MEAFDIVSCLCYCCPNAIHKQEFIGRYLYDNSLSALCNAMHAYAMS